MYESVTCTTSTAGPPGWRRVHHQVRPWSPVGTPTTMCGVRVGGGRTSRWEAGIAAEAAACRRCAASVAAQARAAARRLAILEAAPGMLCAFRWRDGTPVIGADSHPLQLYLKNAIEVVDLVDARTTTHGNRAIFTLEEQEVPRAVELHRVRFRYYRTDGERLVRIFREEG